MATPNGSSLYVVATGSRDVVKLDRKNGHYDIASRSTKLSYSPDNIRWTPNRRHIFVGGQVTAFKKLMACNAKKIVRCENIPAQVELLDPSSMQLTSLLPAGDYDHMTASTGGVIANDELWLSSPHDDRVGIIPLKHQ